LRVVYWIKFIESVVGEQLRLREPGEAAMKGKIIGFTPSAGTGAISSDDGERYAFEAAQWRSEKPIAAGATVDFVGSAGAATEIYPIAGSALGSVDVGEIAASPAVQKARRLAMETLVFPLAALLLAACSGGADNAAKPAEQRKLAADEGPSGAMTYWGDKVEIDCPGEFGIAKRPDGAGVDDIRGLRLGVPGETAIRFAQCPDGDEADSIYKEADTSFERNALGLKIRTSATVAVGEHKERWGGRINVMDMNPTDRLQTTGAIWHFTMDGMPGKETLFAMALDQPFAEGSQPTVESQVAGLKAKYGAPNYSDARARMFWLHLPDGKPIPAFDRTLLQNCSYSVDAAGRSLRWGPDCGLAITAEVTPAANPLLARQVQVAAFEPAKLWDYHNNRFEAERDALLATQAGSQAKNAKGGQF
jgi:hypothetical protein